MRTPLVPAAIAICGFVLGGCGGAPRKQATLDPLPVPTATAQPTAIVEAPPAPVLPPVELAAGTPAAPPEKAPTVAIKAPAANQEIPADKAGDFEVKLDVKNWDAPKDAKHVHLILDGRPYKRIDDPKAPIKLKDLDPTYTLAEGQHVLVAFPSRHTHESVKPVGKAAPLGVVTFWVGKKGTPTWKPTDPTLIFSRPKGINPGPLPEEGMLIDFYLANAELGDGKYSVDLTLTGPGADLGMKAKITSWTPWRIKNARDGKYSIKMALLDKDGKVVPGAWNDTTREFWIDTKAVPPADHQHAPAATPPAATPPAATPPATTPPATTPPASTAPKSPTPPPTAAPKQPTPPTPPPTAAPPAAKIPAPASTAPAMK